MKKIFLTFIFIWCGQPGAQEYTAIDSLMFGKTLWTEDISYNSSLLIPKYFNEGKFDSVEIILDYWDEKAGSIEPVVRFEILYAIYKGNFSENIYDDLIVRHLLMFKSRKEYEAEIDDPEWDVTYYSFGSGVRHKKYISSEFNAFTAKLASDLLASRVKEGDVEYPLCLFYSCDFDGFFSALRSGRYDETDLKYFMDRYADYKAGEPETNLTIFTGNWMPRGSNALLGNHPQIGVTTGLKVSRIMFDLVAAIRFLDSKNSYQVEYEGRVITTRSFQDSYLGGELGYELFRTNHFSFNIWGGIAWDALIPVGENSDKDQKARRIETTNVNYAAGIRYYFSPYSSRYIGIQFRNNLVNYRTKTESDLSGNVFSLRFSFGLNSNKSKHRILKLLGYSYNL